MWIGSKLTSSYIQAYLQKGLKKHFYQEETLVPNYRSQGYFLERIFPQPAPPYYTLDKIANIVSKILINI
jgi:hypothetical protein